MVSRGRFRDAMKAITSMLVGKIFPAAFSFPFSLLIFGVSGYRTFANFFISLPDLLVSTRGIELHGYEGEMSMGTSTSYTLNQAGVGKTASKFYSRT